MRLSKAETRILEQVWKLGTCSVREILESLMEKVVEDPSLNDRERLLALLRSSGSSGS